MSRAELLAREYWRMSLPTPGGRQDGSWTDGDTLYHGDVPMLVLRRRPGTRSFVAAINVTDHGPVVRRTLEHVEELAGRHINAVRVTDPTLKDGDGLFAAALDLIDP